MKRLLLLAACVLAAGCGRREPPAAPAAAPSTNAAPAPTAAVAPGGPAASPAPVAPAVALPKVSLPEVSKAEGDLAADLKRVVALEADAQFAEALRVARELRQTYRSHPEVGKVDQLIQRLSQIKGDAVTLPMLVRNLGSSNGTDRAVARSRLAGAGDVGRVFLRKAVRESEPEVAAHAAKLLAELRDPQVADAVMVRVGREPDWLQRAPAADALRASAEAIPPERIPALYAATRGDAAFARKGAVPALGRVFSAVAKGNAETFDTLAGEPGAYSNLMAYADAAFASTNQALCLWACQEALPFGRFRRDPFYARNPVLRSALLRARGGGPQTEQAVDRALTWLRNAQEPDGHWNVQRHGGNAGRDVAGTAFALLCFSASGAKHTEPGPYRAVVSNAVEWLMAQCRPGGDLRGAGTMYDHGFAALALADVYGMTHDPRLLGVATGTVQFIVAAQHKTTGGWRYNPGEEGDTSVFSSQLVALRTADLAGLGVPEETTKLAGKWLDRVQGGEENALFGYDNNQPRPAMTAAGMVCRQFLGLSYDDPKMQAAARYVAANVPSYSNPDFYFWYYATQALFHQGGVNWDAWNMCLKQELLSGQLRIGTEAGSWEPAGPFAEYGGRVITTAMATLCLQVYYRYPLRHDFSLKPLIDVGPAELKPPPVAAGG
jgi:hypothetical protein